MSHFPLSLDLTGRRVVLVGGGRVALRRALAFADAGADLVVVSPALARGLSDLVAEGRVAWIARGYRTGDLAGAWLAHTATGVPAVDAQVSADAADARIWSVDATDAARASVHVPARRVVESDSGPVTIAVNASADPIRARAIAIRLAASLGAWRDKDHPTPSVHPGYTGATGASRQQKVTPCA